jgi:hypothetical protein
MPEWIAEATLTVDPPRRFVILHVGARSGSMGDGLSDHPIGIFQEEFDASACDPSAVGVELRRVGWIDFVKEEGGSRYFEADNAAKIPKLACPKCLPVPRDGCLRIRDNEHYR